MTPRYLPRVEEPLSAYLTVVPITLKGELLDELTRSPLYVFLNVGNVVEGTWLGYLKLV